MDFIINKIFCFCPILQFFNYVSYLIGGEVFTLQDIENGVLRGNRKGVAQLLRPFSKTDPRLQVLKTAEHFTDTPVAVLMWND